MNVFLIGEDEALAQSIRQIMMRERVYFPVSSLISFNQVTRRLTGVTIDMVVAVLPDDPLRCVEALEILATIPRTERTLVIAVGLAADAKMVIRALRGVVDDYLDLADLDNELVSVLARWRQRWSLDRPEGKLVAILGPSGGAGASTLTVNLAVQVARLHKTVGLIDLKMETGDLATLLDLKPNYSLANLSKNIDRLDETFFQQALVAHSSGVHLLASPKNLSEIEFITAEGIRQCIGLARSTFPFVFVDLDHRFGAEQVQVLRQADLILVVLRLDFTSLKNATKFLDHLEALGVPANRVRMIANRQGQPKEVPLAKVEAALRTKVFHALPEDPKAVNRANNNGIPVTLDYPSSRIARSLIKLAEAIQAPSKPESIPEKKTSAAESTTITHPGSQNSRIGPAADYRPNLTNLPTSVGVGRETRS